MRAPGAILCALCCAGGPACAANLVLTGGSVVKTVSATDLVAGAGSEFHSPLETDVLLATLQISGTGGGHWNVKVAREGSELDLPAGVTISLKRSGGLNENGIAYGTSYQALTGSLATFFAGTGDYSNIQILMKLDGVTIHTAPRLYGITVRYTLEEAP